MRDRFLIHIDIVHELGGAEEVAKLCAVLPGTVRKWMQDPDVSGQDIPVRHLQSILIESGKRLQNLKLQNLIDELLGDHFAGLCRRRLLLEDKVFEMVEFLMNGQRVGPISRAAPKRERAVL